MIRDDVDFYTRSGATKLRDKIESYWLRRGYPGVRVQVVTLPGFDAPHFGLKSNIVNGFPPRHSAR